MYSPESFDTLLGRDARTRNVNRGIRLGSCRIRMSVPAALCTFGVGVRPYLVDLVSARRSGSRTFARCGSMHEVARCQIGDILDVTARFVKSYLVSHLFRAWIVRALVPCSCYTSAYRLCFDRNTVKNSISAVDRNFSLFFVADILPFRQFLRYIVKLSEKT